MTRDVLRELNTLTRLKYDVERSKLKAFFERETSLRNDLAELETQLNFQSTIPVHDLAGPRSIGADLLWRGWMDQKRADLNQALARHLAQKESVIADLRRAYGKKMASEALATAAEIDASRQKISKHLEGVLALTLQQSHRS